MNINKKSIFNAFLVICAGIAAAISKYDEQKKEEKINDMEARIKNLESKVSE